MSSSSPADSGLHPFEIGAFGDRDVLQVAVQVGFGVGVGHADILSAGCDQDRRRLTAG